MECCRKCTETGLRYLVHSEERDTEFLVDLEDVLWDGLENLSFWGLYTAHFKWDSMF